MTRTIRTQQIRLAVLTGLCGLLLAAPQSASANDGNHGIVGAWAVQVTLRNCDTNAPMGSFSSLVSFHRGGTLSEGTSSLAFRANQRSDGHGAWKHLRGHTYSQRMIALIRFDSAPNLPGTPTFDQSQPVSPGFSAGWQTVSHRVRMTGADTFESSGANEFFDSAGTSYRTGCSTAVGRRFE